MSGKYVPPARRQQLEASTKSEAEQPMSMTDPDAHLVSLEEIKNYFWPVREGDDHQGRYSEVNKTLHDGAQTPGRLAYVVLFTGANPRWESDRIIFTKSNLDLLPTDMADSVAVKDKSISPIGVFKQAAGGTEDGRVYAFEGCFQVVKVQILEPGTPELARMLDQKWSRTNAYGKVRHVQRDEAAWKASLGQRWAVVKMEKDEAARKDRGIPKIEMLPGDNPEPLTAKKSVNEMLNEMRSVAKKDDAIEA